MVRNCAPENPSLPISSRRHGFRVRSLHSRPGMTETSFTNSNEAIARPSPLAAFAKPRNSVHCNESPDGQGGVMNRAGKISVSLMLLTAAISIGNREVRAQIQPQQAQQNPVGSVLSQILAANE